MNCNELLWNASLIGIITLQMHGEGGLFNEAIINDVYAVTKTLEMTTSKTDFF